MLPYLVAALLVVIALVTGHILPVLVVGLVLLLLRHRGEREMRRQRAIEALLRTVGSKPDGVIARPGHTRFMADELWPKAQQWSLIESVPDLIVVRNRPGAPRHLPPDVVGCVVRLTDDGRLAFRKAVAAARNVPQARARLSA